MRTNFNHNKKNSFCYKGILFLFCYTNIVIACNCKTKNKNITQNKYKHNTKKNFT